MEEEQSNNASVEEKNVNHGGDGKELGDGDGRGGGQNQEPMGMTFSFGSGVGRET